MTDVTVNADDLRAVLDYCAGDYALEPGLDYPAAYPRLRAALPFEPDEEVVRRWPHSDGLSRQDVGQWLRELHDVGLDVVVRDG